MIYLDGPNGNDGSRLRLKQAATYYGLSVDREVIDGRQLPQSVVDSVSDPQTIAVVMNASLLSLVDRRAMFTSVHGRAKPLPFLIDDIKASTSAAALSGWSDGAVIPSPAATKGGNDGYLLVADFSAVTKELSGIKLPGDIKCWNSLTVAPDKKQQGLLTAYSARGNTPVFAMVQNASNPLFFLAANAAEPVPITSDPYDLPAVFAPLAPYLMFLRAAGGDAIWHSPGAYANLTIDDIWLKPQYGFVNYQALLTQMDKHQFHTTAAFIPWNFDRSAPEIVSLFKARPDRFSICIHGNNHDGEEFGPYTDRTLQEQATNIAQSVARMERFKSLTSIDYDRVMVFPHSIAPTATLGVLKQFNFLATANSRNVPSDASVRGGHEFALHAATLEFQNFTSLRRYSDETKRPPSQVAIEAFLGNPLLFYVHHGYFSSGAAAFNETADEVNRLVPSVLWTGLGDIAEHLYVVRTRPDGNQDIRAYAPRIKIDNKTPRDVTYHIEKIENFTGPVTTSVNGAPYKYELKDGTLRLQITLPPHSSRTVNVHYGPSSNEAVSIAKNSVRIRIIRYLSDWRDDVLWRSNTGRWFARSYSNHGGIWKLTATVALLLLLSSFWLIPHYFKAAPTRPIHFFSDGLRQRKHQV